MAEISIVEALRDKLQDEEPREKNRKKRKTEKKKPVKLQRFSATVLDADGNHVRTKIKAATRSRARLALTSEGLNVVEVHPVPRWWEIEIGRAIPADVLLQATRQLSAFTSAGVPLLESLYMLSDSTKNKRMRQTLIAVAEDVRDGDTLPQAARAHPAVFPAYYVSILDASERSGDLSTTFETLSAYLDRDLTSRRAVKAAMYYPLILVVLSVVAVVVLSTAVLPKFEVFFDSLNAELPLATRILLGISRFFATWWWAVLLGFLVLVEGMFLLRRTDRGRLWIDKGLLRLPIFGKLIEFVALERFSRVLGSLSSAGVPLPDGLQLAAGVMGNRSFDLAVRSTREGVLRGEGLTVPMEATGVFPPETVQILRVGEQSGRLVNQLEMAADFYSKEVDYRLKNLTALIEPVVLLVVGGGVGFVAVALVSAMYGIYTSTNLGG